MRLSLFLLPIGGRRTSLNSETLLVSVALYFSLVPDWRLFAGGHRGVVIPVPIPNTEVKGSIAEGSAGLARARVGRCRLFLLPFGNKTPSSSYGRTPASAPFGLGFAEGDTPAFFIFSLYPLAPRRAI